MAKGLEMKWYRLDAIPIKRRVRVTKTGRTYTDIKTIHDLDMVRDSYDGNFYEECPVALHIVMYKQLPKSKRDIHPFITKPDVDNVIKCVMDGLNGVAFADDRQVTLVVAEKLDRQDFGGEFCMYQIAPVEQFKKEFSPWRI